MEFLPQSRPYVFSVMLVWAKDAGELSHSQLNKTDGIPRSMLGVKRTCIEELVDRSLARGSKPDLTVRSHLKSSNSRLR